MIKVLFAIFVALLVAFPGSAATLPDFVAPRLFGQGTSSVLGVRLYRARLWGQEEGRLEAPLKLELTYFRDISKSRLISFSLKEIQRIHPNVGADKLGYWNRAMASAFEDIRAGDSMIALFDFQSGVSFYHNQLLTAEIRDPDFARMFSDIWLSSDARDESLRRALTGQLAR